MRQIHLTLICLLAMVCLLPLSAARVTLTMTASADRDVLLTRRPMLPQQAVDKPCMLDLVLESANVTLTFTNTGNAPLRLNTYELTSRLQMSIIGPPDLNGRQTNVIQVPCPLFTTSILLPPSANDFPVLPSGKSWSIAVPISFPYEDIGGIHYLLQSTGVYHVRFLYSFIPSNYPEHDNLIQMWSDEDNPWNDIAFHGAVGSNPLTFTLVEAGEPVNGLQMALAAQPPLDPLSNEVTLTAYLRNLSDKPIYLNAWDLCQDGLLFARMDGTVISVRGGARGRSEIVPADRYITLLPGDKHAFPLPGVYFPFLDNLNSQAGHFTLIDRSGFFRDWPLQGHTACATALLDIADGPGSVAGDPGGGVATALLGIPDAPLAQVTSAPGPLWVGKVTSPSVRIPINSTAYRQAKLKQEIAHFALRLSCDGPTGPPADPYYTLRLQVQPLKQGAASRFDPILQLSDTEAATLIDFLAKTGALRDASTPAIAASAPCGYTLEIFGAPDNGKREVASWTLPLGWNLAMYRQLQALGDHLPNNGKRAMALLLKSLEYDYWVTEDALRQPAVTLDTPAGTFNKAANAIVAASGCPGLKLNLDAPAGASSMPACHFFNVTADEAFRYLAQAANVTYTMGYMEAIFHTKKQE